MKKNTIPQEDLVLLKYHIEKLLLQLNYQQYYVAIKELPKRLGMTYQNFRHYRLVKKDSPKLNLTSDKMTIIANYFSEVLKQKITLDDLVNT